MCCLAGPVPLGSYNYTLKMYGRDLEAFNAPEIYQGYRTVVATVRISACSLTTTNSEQAEHRDRGMSDAWKISLIGHMWWARAVSNGWDS